MKIRLHGLPEEVEQTKKVIKMLFNVNQASEPYNDRGDSKYVRCYIDVDSVSDAVMCYLEKTIHYEFCKSAFLKCENCLIKENCLAFKDNDTKSLSGCVAMQDLVLNKLLDEINPFYEKDDRDGVRSVIEKYYGVKKGGNE